MTSVMYFGCHSSVLSEIPNSLVVFEPLSQDDYLFLIFTYEFNGTATSSQASSTSCPLGQLHHWHEDCAGVST
jgi:hypothetical protein